MGASDFVPLEPKEDEANIDVKDPVSIDDGFDVLDKWFDTGKDARIAEGRRIEFFEGKRKMKDGKLKKTGHAYWRWSFKTDTGRKRPYGGAIATVPAIYQHRRREYEARIASRSPESLADALFRPSFAGLSNGDTGEEQ